MDKVIQNTSKKENVPEPNETTFGRNLAERLKCGQLFCDKQDARKHLKLVMTGNRYQMFLIKKGYEEVIPPFNRERVASEILRLSRKTLKEPAERRFFGFAVFDWLIRRYDFISAWKVLAWLKNPEDEKGHRLFPWIWVICLLLIGAGLVAHVVLASTVFGVVYVWPVLSVSIFLGLLLRMLWLVRWKFGDLVIGIRLFVPRLAAAIFLGHFFISSADELRCVIRQEVSPLTAVVVSLASLAIASAYLWLEMANQLVPRPDWEVVSGRILQLLPIGICYSLMIGLVMQWIFAFSTTCTLSSNWTAYLTSTSVALVLGLLLQILWEEKPVTEPI